jgi:cytochrome P450
MSLSKLQTINFAEHLAAINLSIQNVAKYLVDLSENYLVPAAKEHKTLVTVALVMLGSQVYYWHKFSYWSRRNVKTPRPVPVFGNFLSVLLNYRQQLELEWPKKFGKVYGFYLGTSPRLVIADASVLREICIKNFSAFPNHHFFNVPNKYQKHFLVTQKDDHWRAVRAILTPTFSSGRIKAMYRLLSDCADDLCREHQRRIDIGEPIIDTRQIYGSFSMSSTLKSFYGLNLSLNLELQLQQEKAAAKNMERKQVATGNEQMTAAAFAKRSKEAFQQNLVRFAITNIFPANLLDFLGYHSMDERRLEFFAEMVKKLIEQRQRATAEYNDYLQLLIKAKASDEIERTENEHHEDHHAAEIDNQMGAWRASKMKLTEMETLCLGMMFVLVATETTKTLISHAIYLLARHKDIQERLHKEVMQIATYEERNDSQWVRSFKYDDLIACEYLDCVISETLRLMPPILVMDRVASEDYHIEKYNVTVPKGTIINLAYYSIHNDPDYWPEPAKFDPERFNRENRRKIVPGSYTPFGMGPRACIGFRFALAEAKVGIAKLLCEFEFEPAPNTKYPPEPITPTFVQNDYKDLRVKVSKRSLM